MLDLFFDSQNPQIRVEVLQIQLGTFGEVTIKVLDADSIIWMAGKLLSFGRQDERSEFIPIQRNSEMKLCIIV